MTRLSARARRSALVLLAIWWGAVTPARAASLPFDFGELSAWWNALWQPPGAPALESAYLPEGIGVDPFGRANLPPDPAPSVLTTETDGAPSGGSH